MILKLIDFLTRTFGTTKDTTANILVTISTFAAGILITLIFKAVERYFDRRNHRKLVRLNLITLMKEMYRQAVAYKKFADGLTIETTTPAFKQMSISSVGIFQQLGYKSLYDSFFNGFENIHFRRGKKKRIAFNNLWSTLEYLTVFHQKTFKDAKEFIELEKSNNDLRNQSISETFKIINAIRLTFNGETLPQSMASYCLALEDILKKHQKLENNTTPKTVNDHLILPIIELNNRHYELPKEYLESLKPVALNALLNDCLIRYENQKRHLDSNQQYFGHLNESFLTNYNKLKFSYRTLF